jgi:hypothetical protein
MTFSIFNLKIDVNVPSKRNKQTNVLYEKNFFVGVLKVTDEMSRIRIRKSVVRIHGSAYVSQRQQCSKLRDFGSRKFQKNPNIYKLEHRILTQKGQKLVVA